MSEFRAQPKGFATKAIHVGQDPEQWSHQSVIPPLVTSTTFKQPAPAEPIVSANFLVVTHDFQFFFSFIKIQLYSQFHSKPVSTG